MQDSNYDSIIDDIAARGTKLDSFSVEVKYQAFIGDYGATGTKGWAMHVVIKCNGKVRLWESFPIARDEPFKEMISSYMRSALEENLKKAADKTLNDALLGTARNDMALDFVEFCESAPLEKSRIERVLAEGQEVIEGRIAEEASQITLVPRVKRGAVSVNKDQRGNRLPA